MKFTARERTGLRAMVELARHYGSGSPTSLSEVARAQELSLPYLEQVVGSLRRAGLLERMEIAAIVVRRPLEHQVLEQVGEPGATGALVLGPDVVPHVDRHDRAATVLVDDDVQSVVERLVDERNIQHAVESEWGILPGNAAARQSDSGRLGRGGLARSPRAEDTGVAQVFDLRRVAQVEDLGHQSSPWPS